MNRYLLDRIQWSNVANEVERFTVSYPKGRKLMLHKARSWLEGQGKG